MSRFSEWVKALDQNEPRLYMVAEMANAHEGSLDIALAIAEEAKRAGADSIKFQCFTAAELLVPQHSKYETFRDLEMPWEDWQKLFDGSKALGLDVFCDVFGHESAGRIIALHPTGLKVHASDVPNTPLLKAIGASGLPVFLSTGGVNWVEVAEALDTLREAGAGQIVLINGIQRYPTSIEDSDLLRVRSLADRFSIPVGYADHIDGESPDALWLPFLAAAAGARLIEKHITLDRSQKGTDYYSSLNPDEFTRLVEMARRVESALGSMDLTLSEAEQAYRQDAMKSLVTARSIPENETLTENDVTYKRIETEVSPRSHTTAVGRKADHDLQKDEPLTSSDVSTRIFASLACRVQSVRLYAKPLQLIGDRPILSHLIDRLNQVDRIDGIVLAISEGDENALFVDMAKERGYAYVVGDEKDVLGRHIQAAHSVGADIVIRVTTENPFVHQEIIGDLIQHHLDTNADLTVCEMLPDGAYAEVINVSALERAHAHGEDRHRSELCTLFIFENPDVFKIEKIQAPVELARPDIRLTIDTPEDLILARGVYAGLEAEFGSSPPLNEIIKYLDKNDGLRAMNAHLRSESTKLWR